MEDDEGQMLLEFPRRRCSSYGTPHTVRSRLDTSVNWDTESISKVGLDFMRLESLATVALPVGYFSVGVAQKLMITPLQYYLVSQRNVGSTAISVMGPIMSLPWCFKIGYGILSDCVPIYGEKRRPYFVIGWASYAVLCFAVSMCIRDISFASVMLLVFLQTCAYLMSDVAADTMIVERSNRLGEHGTMQGTCYLLRFTGGVIGSIVGAILGDPSASAEHSLSIEGIFVLSGVAGLLPLLFSSYLVETPTKRECDVMSEMFSEAPFSDMDDVGSESISKTPRPKSHTKSLWSELEVMEATLAHQAVYQPMAFIILYNIMQVTNAAWSNFLVIGLKFTETDIGMIAIAGSIVTWGGIAVYRRFLMDVSWRSVYLVTTAITFVLSLGQLVLISGVNRRLGISDVFFAAGDTTVGTFVTAMQFLPAVTMYLSMCPEGAEGSVFALLTTMSNLSGVCAGNISTLLADMWWGDISNRALSAGDFAGLFSLSIVSTLLNPLPLVFIWLLPASSDDQKRLRLHGAFKPAYGRALLLLVGAAIVWTILQNASVALAAA